MSYGNPSLTRSQLRRFLQLLARAALDLKDVLTPDEFAMFTGLHSTGGDRATIRSTGLLSLACGHWADVRRSQAVQS